MGFVRKLRKKVERQVKQTVKDVGRAPKSIANSVKVNTQNASKGEVGKYVTGVAQSSYNLVSAVPRAVKSGDWEKESQRFVGSAVNLSTGGAFSYLGQSSGVQKALNNETLNDWTLGTAKNYAGTYHGIGTMSQHGYLTNADRVQMQQLGVKAAAVYAGGAAYGYMTAPSEAAYGSGVLTAPAYGSSGAAATSIGAANTATGAGAAAAAAGAGGGWLSTGASSLGYYGILKSVLTGERSIGDAYETIVNGGAPQADITPIYRDVMDYLNRQPSYVDGVGASVAESEKLPILPLALVGGAIFLLFLKGKG